MKKKNSANLNNIRKRLLRGRTSRRKVLQNKTLTTVKFTVKDSVFLLFSIDRVPTVRNSKILLQNSEILLF